jgi:hypothetical protein
MIGMWLALIRKQAELMPVKMEKMLSSSPSSRTSATSP